MHAWRGRIDKTEKAKADREGGKQAQGIIPLHHHHLAGPFCFHLSQLHHLLHHYSAACLPSTIRSFVPTSLPLSLLPIPCPSFSNTGGRTETQR
eukprot:c34728_g1_i1 orf=126-407(+)